jgi:hypothetical protein
MYGRQVAPLRVPSHKTSVTKQCSRAVPYESSCDRHLQSGVISGVALNFDEFTSRETL